MYEWLTIWYSGSVLYLEKGMNMLLCNADWLEISKDRLCIDQFDSGSWRTMISAPVLLNKSTNQSLTKFVNLLRNNFIEWTNYTNTTYFFRIKLNDFTHTESLQR